MKSIGGIAILAIVLIKIFLFVGIKHAVSSEYSSSATNNSYTTSDAESPVSNEPSNSGYVIVALCTAGLLLYAFYPSGKKEEEVSLESFTSPKQPTFTKTQTMPKPQETYQSNGVWICPDPRIV